MISFLNLQEAEALRAISATCKQLANELNMHASIVYWGANAYSVGSGGSADEAKIKAIWKAEKQGWTNPRWYEFWRIWRGDTWFDPAEIARLKAEYGGDNPPSKEVG